MDGVLGDFGVVDGLYDGGDGELEGNDVERNAKNASGLLVMLLVVMGRLASVGRRFPSGSREEGNLLICPST